MSEEEIKQLKIERDNAMLERDTAIFVAKERLDIIERIKNQKEIFELRYLKAEQEIERLHSIIKEVREYIENAFATGEEIFKVEILEILDKEK